MNKVSREDLLGAHLASTSYQSQPQFDRNIRIPSYRCTHADAKLLEACGDDDVALFVIPAIAEVEIDRRRSALVENFFELRLIVLFEDFNRADVIAEDADVPFVAVKVGDRNARVILHDGAAVSENEIADAIEPAFEHQIGRRF